MPGYLRDRLLSFASAVHSSVLRPSWALISWTGKTLGSWLWAAARAVPRLTRSALQGAWDLISRVPALLRWTWRASGDLSRRGYRGLSAISSLSWSSLRAFGATLKEAFFYLAAAAGRWAANLCRALWFLAGATYRGIANLLRFLLSVVLVVVGRLRLLAEAFYTLGIEMARGGRFLGRQLSSLAVAGWRGSASLCAATARLAVRSWGFLKGAFFSCVSAFGTGLRFLMGLVGRALGAVFGVFGRGALYVGGVLSSVFGFLIPARVGLMWEATCTLAASFAASFAHFWKATSSRGSAVFATFAGGWSFLSRKVGSTCGVVGVTATSTGFSLGRGFGKAWGLVAGIKWRQLQFWPVVAFVMSGVALFMSGAWWSSSKVGVGEGAGGIIGL